MENLRVVLVATRNPLNMGAVARAMSNFGAGELRAVEPYGKAWREARSAVGAGDVMAAAREFANLAEAVADCSLVVGTTSVGNREMKHPLHDLAEAAPLLQERMRTGRVAVLFGSEKFGLSNEELSYCHWLLRIPTREEHRSMKLGQAAAVVLYEIGGKGSKGGERVGGPSFAAKGAAAAGSRATEKKRRKVASKDRGKEMGEGRHAGPDDAMPRVGPGLDRLKPILLGGGVEEAGMKASATGKKEETRTEAAGTFAEMETVERIGEALLKALKKSGYVGKRKDELAEEKLRRMLRRFSLSSADAEVFLGMVRKIEQELK